MNTEASRTIATEFLQGVFDVLDAMLSVSFNRRITALADADTDAVARFIERHPVAMRATVPSGGAVVLLFSVADASRFATLVMGEAPVIKAALDPNDLLTLREVAEPALGGGITCWMESSGRAVEQPQDLDVTVMEPDEAPQLTAALGEAHISAVFTFSAAPDIDSAGVMLFSAELERMAVPADLASASAAPGRQPLLSENELGDILGAFDTGRETETPAARAGMRPSGAAAVPQNLDMVLDIRLMATARLGRVDMSIGDILMLGPGSIIPVGRLVDEPVELLVNNKLIARGDVVVVDEKFGLRITEIVSQKERIESMH